MVAINYERCSLVISMPYSKQCVHEIKEQLPAHARRWDPTDRVWYVSPAYLGNLVQILREFFGEDEIYIDRNIPSMATLRDALEPGESPYSEMYLLPNAPKEVCYAAYRALAKLFHPDVNVGGSEQMKRINLAWEKLKNNNKN